MSSAKLDLVPFGEKLFETKDLDPVYNMLYSSDLKEEDLKRWVLAYWCFYHPGVCSWITESDDLYEAMYTAIEEKFPRGSERRHFRGESSKKSVKYLEDRYPQPESAIDELFENKDFQSFYDSIREWYLFGDWIAFKAADMMDRVFLREVDFSNCGLNMYQQPVEGAKLYSPDQSLNETVEELKKVFRSYKAPPEYERKVGLQEVETVLCKWKSHQNGHYPIGNDIVEVREALEGGEEDWGDLADHLEKSLPELDRTSILDEVGMIKEE